jgi:hypothetical protein
MRNSSILRLAKPCLSECVGKVEFIASSSIGSGARRSIRKAGLKRPRAVAEAEW